jgi:hypothetical protein
MPGRREAHAMSLMAIVVGIILCGVSVFRGFHGQAFMGRPLGGDFVEFYAIGKILNNYESFRIYDLQLAVGLQHATLATMPETEMLVFGHAPYIAYLFRPFASLSYAWAYIAWLAFSASLYLLSLFLLFRSGNLPREDRKTGLLLAFSSVPFILETWMGGQLSVVVFFAWALFFYFRHKDRMFLAGIALSFGLFKPTLVVLPAVMLLCGRRWRTLAGLSAGAFALALASIKMVGLRGCRAWIDTLLFLARANAGPGEVWHLAKYVDSMSFFHLLIRNAPVFTGILSSVIGVVVFAMLAAAWFRSSARAGQPEEDLLWAATLCFTLVVNSYAPIYDSILVVSAVVLVAGAMDNRNEHREAFHAWLLALYMVPWISQSFAEFLHFQLFTIALAGFATWALRLDYKGRETLQTGAAEVLAIR